MAVSSTMLRPLLVTTATICLAAGCVVAPVAPPISNPAGRRPGTLELTAGAGVSTNLGAEITVDGERREIVYHPRKVFAAFEMLVIAVRRAISHRCDVGVDLGFGRLGGDARCGTGGEQRAVSGSIGAYFLPWHGARAVAQVQAGLRAGGRAGSDRLSFRALVSTGVAVSRWGHRIALENWEFGSDPFSGPPTPAVDVSQSELSWISTASYAIDFAMMGFELDLPLVTGGSSYDCVDCAGPMAFERFDPGWRIGVFVGISGP